MRPRTFKPRIAKRSGFTLVELSIVLVIIGLLVGGVLVGADLIRGAEIKKSIDRMREVNTAFRLFRQEYKQYPGDFSQTTRFWDASIPSGNGDGEVKSIPGFDEEELVWLHLYKASLWPEKLSGVAAGGQVLGGNIPEAPFDSSGFRIKNNGHLGRYGAHVSWAGLTDTAELTASIFPPAEARLVDEKYDDGKPDSGDLYASAGSEDYGTFCINYGDMTYKQGAEILECSFIFWIER